jgi:hypothetical protein
MAIWFDMEGESYVSDEMLHEEAFLYSKLNV